MAGAVLPFPVGVQSRRASKTALMWHQLKAESARMGRPIVCVECFKPHDGPPRFGRCACGAFAFGIRADTQLPLSLDFHGGEQ